MSIFDRTRLADDVFALDVPRLQQGYYTDQYFRNIVHMLEHAANHGTGFAGHAPRLAAQGIDASGLPVGDGVVEMQWFTRRAPFTVVAGIDEALAMLRLATGYHADGQFVRTSHHLEVEAVQDGVLVPYDGDPLAVRPVLKVRGRYRDFAVLETTTLGAMARASRIATNVYLTMQAARGKPVLFFPARFDSYTVQAADGYAYRIGVQRYNHDTGKHAPVIVSTAAQGAWWGGTGSGTMAHAGIAAFFGDTPAAMLAFAAAIDPAVMRTALVDFDNDCVGTTLAVMDAMFARYRALTDAGDPANARRYVLGAVRPDTSGSLRDVSVPPLGLKQTDMGVTPRLMFLLREAINNAWQRWDVPANWHDHAREWCHNVQLVATGGFDREKISRFEALGVPVDIYGVGSSLYSNSSSDGTTTDFTADIVRVQVNGEWYPLAKVGRQACANPDLERIQ